MLFLTYSNNATKHTRPIDNVQPNYSPPYTKHSSPPAKYYRKTNQCGTECGEINKIIKVVDCNACKVTYSANTVLNANTNEKTYYASNREYMKARCRTYDQGLTTNNYNSTTNSIKKSCCDDNNNCGTYKRNNNKFNKQGAVSSSARLLRLKYNSITTSGKYNNLRTRYRGDTSSDNVLFKPAKANCVRRNGDNTRCS